MMWKDKEDGRASELVTVDEFRSFVKPIWNPELTEFCTNLTGITQVRPFTIMSIGCTDIELGRRRRSADMA
jgi:hypothetical protein